MRVFSENFVKNLKENAGLSSEKWKVFNESPVLKIKENREKTFMDISSKAYLTFPE